MAAPRKRGEHLDSVVSIHRLAHDPAIQHDNRVSADEKAAACFTRSCRTGLFLSQPQGMGDRLFVGQRHFLNVRWRHPERDTGQFQQFGATGRGRGQHDHRLRFRHRCAPLPVFCFFQLGPVGLPVLFLDLMQQEDPRNDHQTEKMLLEMPFSRP